MLVVVLTWEGKIWWSEPLVKICIASCVCLPEQQQSYLVAIC